MKFDLEIAIDQQTRACNRSFEGAPESGCPPVPAGQPRPFLVQIMPIYAQSPQGHRGEGGSEVDFEILSRYVVELDLNFQMFSS